MDYASAPNRIKERGCSEQQNPIAGPQLVAAPRRRDDERLQLMSPNEKNRFERTYPLPRGETFAIMRVILPARAAGCFDEVARFAACPKPVEGSGAVGLDGRQHSKRF